MLHAEVMDHEVSIAYKMYLQTLHILPISKAGTNLLLLNIKMDLAALTERCIIQTRTHSTGLEAKHKKSFWWVLLKKLLIRIRHAGTKHTVSWLKLVTLLAKDKTALLSSLQHRNDTINLPKWSF